MGVFFSGFMQMALTFFYNLTGKIGFPNYGLAIILLTVVIRMLLFPLTAKQLKSMEAMRQLSPKLKELQEKYKNDQPRQQQEVAKLYKTAGVNPLTGCLPLLVQMPLLTGIFYAIRTFHYVSQPSFFWIRTLAGSDPLYIMPLLAALTTYVSSRQTMLDSGQQTKIMQMLMPLFIGFMTLRFPAALGLYWVSGNLIQILQQRLLYRSWATPS